MIDIIITVENGCVMDVEASKPEKVKVTLVDHDEPEMGMEMFVSRIKIQK